MLCDISAGSVAGDKNVSFDMEDGRAGWLYRVIKPGVARVGDELTLVSRGPDPVLTVTAATRLVIPGVSTWYFRWRASRCMVGLVR